MNVQVVSASAGTGKTHHLTREVREALVHEGVRPEGLVAITYTKKAAAELASRLRTDLTAAGRGDLAGRVRDGYLGTVHSVCERLLSEFALEAGHSPYLQPIAEAQRERLFADALAGVLAGREERIEFIAGRFGLAKWDRGPLRRIVELARENGLDGEAVRDSGERSVRSILAHLPPVSIQMDQYLRRLADEARTAAANLRDLNGSSKAAKERLDVVEDLVRVLGRQGLPPWAAGLRVVNQKWPKVEAPLVAGLLDAVASHLGCDIFHRDIEELTRGLFEIAADALKAYALTKQSARVVDYQDMLALAAGLLEQPAVAGALSRKLDLVVVDEFQDTSPMQLAVVSALARIAKRSVWVGDRKQAIFGFQGSDPVLMNEAMQHALGGREPMFLSKSWRSRPPLVEFTSELFAKVLVPLGFGEREVRIGTPEERPDPPALASEPVLECWSWEGKGEPEAIADGISKLLADAPPVRDRETRKVRPLARSDLAVLARRKDDCREIATALAARGIPSRTKLSDLSGTPEAILLRSALTLVADPADGVAAMDVSYLSGGAADPDAWLSARLVEAARARAVLQKATAEDGPRPEPALPFSDAPRVAALRALHDSSATLAPTEALDAAVAAAGLLELLRTWPDPIQRLANAEAVRGAARTYEEFCAVHGTAATVAGLVEHLARPPDWEDADLQAVPGSGNAVTVSTWHSAKGLEWPVVVLASLNFARDRDVWDEAVERPEGFDPEHPLTGRWVRYWPWPYANFKDCDLADRVARAREAARIRDDEARERARLLYVAFTRARDRLVLAAATKRGVPEVRALAPLLDADGRPVLELPFGANEGASTARAGSLELPCLARSVSPAPVEPMVVPPAARAWYDGAPRPERPPEALNPSSEPLDDHAPCRIVGVLPLAGRVQLAGAPDMASLGDAVHAFLAADRWAGSREEMAARLLASYGVIGAVAPHVLVRVSDALRAFLDGRFAIAIWRREWPICARLIDRGASRLLRGEVDLFLELTDGFVVVDHKSFPGSERERDERVVAYGAQLGLYAYALERALGKRLLGAFIHLPVRGEIVEVDVGPTVREWTRRVAA